MVMLRLVAARSPLLSIDDPLYPQRGTIAPACLEMFCAPGPPYWSRREWIPGHRCVGPRANIKKCLGPIKVYVLMKSPCPQRCSPHVAGFFKRRTQFYLGRPTFDLEVRLGFCRSTLLLLFWFAGQRYRP